MSKTKVKNFSRSSGLIPKCSGFRDFLDGIGLIDLGFSGHPFTLNNKRVGY